MTKKKQLILNACDLIDSAVDINGSPVPLEMKIVTYCLRNYELLLIFLRYYIERLKHKKK